jgi:large subunit ribosomal protein L23
MKESYDIIDTVCLTEKATLLSGELNKYVFKVSRSANKIEIKNAIEEIFGKAIIGVNTCNIPGKKKRERTAAAGRTGHWKKAFVTLRSGDKIDLA